ncbi:MAG TPA: hypothetical protein VKB45_19070 [Gemmatimonadales bacterium]|nr:hypothetical protein [Gemmatimonadales bacterium]
MKYVIAPLILGAVLVAAATLAMIIASNLSIAPKRPALGAAGAAALLLATRHPTRLWAVSLVRSWEILLGSRRVRIGLVALGGVALLLALFAPLSWLRFLSL